MTGKHRKTGRIREKHTKKTCEQGKSGKNIEKQEKTRANQGKTQKKNM